MCYRLKMFTCVILTLAYLTPSEALFAYDCTHRNTNFTTLSLLDVVSCDFAHVEPESTRVQIQLLQDIEFRPTKITQCKLEIKRTAYACSYFGNLEPLDRGEAEYIHETTRDLCSQLHLTGTFTFGDQHVISGLKVNSTATHALTFAGNAEKCKGAPYTDPFGSFSDALVKGLLKITLVQSQGKVDLTA